MNQTAHQNSHSSLEQLYALVDRQLDPGEHALVVGHLRVCARCRSLYESLVRFDSACKRIPLETVSPAFTRSVLDSLGIVPKSPMIFHLLGGAAYLFALLMVLAFMTAAFVLMGVIRTEDAVAGSGPGAKVFTTIGAALSKASGDLIGWLTEFFPFAFGHGTLSVSAAALVVVLALALVDRNITKKFAQKLR